MPTKINLPFFKIILAILFTININDTDAQNIKSHQWENRLLLVMTDDINNGTYKNQISELKLCKSGLRERKIIVYQIKKDGYKTGLLGSSNWKKSNNLYNVYKKTNSSMEILLIGLDGGIKLRKGKILYCKDLFTVIDVMPMRKSEINNN